VRHKGAAQVKKKKAPHAPRSPQPLATRFLLLLLLLLLLLRSAASRHKAA
jgi:hypothetical protein